MSCIRIGRTMLWVLIAIQSALFPDIQLDARVTARQVEVRESRGVSLTVQARPDAGSEVRVQAPPRRGERVLRNVEVRVQAEARIASPPTNRTSSETPQR